MRGTVIAVGLVAVAAACLWWLQHPPRGDDAYRERSVQTAESLRSYVATARLWAREIGDGRVMRSAAAVALEEVSTSAESTSSTFESWLAPRHLDGLRRTVADAAGAATATLRRLHIAAERDQWHVVAVAPRRLRDLERRLTRVASGARS